MAEASTHIQVVFKCHNCIDAGTLKIIESLTEACDHMLTKRHYKVRPTAVPDLTDAERASLKEQEQQP
jgi:hypothetical protein